MRCCEPRPSSFDWLLNGRRRLNSFEFHIWEWWWDEEERGRVFESKYFRPLARNADIAAAVAARKLMWFQTRFSKHRRRGRERRRGATFDTGGLCLFGHASDDDRGQSLKNIPRLPPAPSPVSSSTPRGRLRRRSSHFFTVSLSPSIHPSSWRVRVDRVR